MWFFSLLGNLYGKRKVGELSPLSPWVMLVKMISFLASGVYTWARTTWCWQQFVQPFVYCNLFYYSSILFLWAVWGDVCLSGFI